MHWKSSIKYAVLTVCYILLTEFVDCNDSDDAEKYNVGGVLTDTQSEKHFRLTISVS